MTRFDDEWLIETLGRAMRAADPIPDQVTQAAKSVFTWRTIEAELLELGFDSAVDELVGVRAGETTVRAVRFATDEVEVELTIDGGAVDGLVVGAGSAVVLLERTDGTRFTSPVDELGRFGFEDVTPGPIRLRVDTGETVLATQWFVI